MLVLLLIIACVILFFMFLYQKSSANTYSAALSTREKFLKEKDTQLQEQATRFEVEKKQFEDKCSHFEIEKKQLEDKCSQLQIQSFQFRNNDAKLAQQEKQLRSKSETIRLLLDTRSELKQQLSELKQQLEEFKKQHQSILNKYLLHVNGVVTTRDTDLDQECLKLLEEMPEQQRDLYITSMLSDYLTAYLKRAKEESQTPARRKVISDIHDRVALTIRRLYIKKYFDQRSFVLNFLRSASATDLNKHLSDVYADISTLRFDAAVDQLDCHPTKKNLEQATSIRSIKSELKSAIEKEKFAEYQLLYLLELYPELQDVVEFNRQDFTIEKVTTDDPVHSYLSKEEWNTLSVSERNQLALDRYIQLHKKSKWQIGRDYELYVGYVYEQKGWSVEYFGSTERLNDLGRDLICKNGQQILLIQCKYWSQKKLIHEKHIMQLYGTMVEYSISNPEKAATGILVTNICLSEKAKEFAKALKIEYIENFDLGDFPRIKCNINNGEKIYHLPMDQQYDSTIIDHPGEMMVSTVKEAEKHGFRRAFRWHSASDG